MCARFRARGAIPNTDAVTPASLTTAATLQPDGTLAYPVRAAATVSESNER